MNIVVQKFGGTSLASQEGRLAAVRHVECALAEAYHVVVVVSAMGRRGDAYATDTLIEAVGESSAVNARDLDILMSCGEAISAVTFATLLRRHGHEVTVLNGLQAGIVTDGSYGDARIVDVRPQRILAALEAGQVVVVMGFQGATISGDITTLGRGGSDTSAAAIGAALDARWIDIFTDVDGIMTADPRIVPDALCLQRASYTDICQMARHGAKVIHPQAVHMAMEKNVPVRVRNTNREHFGTLIADDVSASIAGVAGLSDTWYISLKSDRANPMQYGLAEKHQFAACSEITDAVEKLRACMGNTGYIDVHADSVVVVPGNPAKKELTGLLKELGRVYEVKRCAKVTVIGLDSVTQSEDCQVLMQDTLARNGISVFAAGTSVHTAWCLVLPSEMELTVNLLHEAFRIGQFDVRVSV